MIIIGSVEGWLCSLLFIEGCLLVEGVVVMKKRCCGECWRVDVDGGICGGDDVDDVLMLLFAYLLLFVIYECF